MGELKTYSALVVDDNYYNRDVASLALQHVGCRVAEAGNGLEALEKLRSESYDLLVLDLMMDGLDGAGVLREYQPSANARKMFVVVMTANPHMITEDIANRADLVLQKPIEIQELAILTKRLINRS